MINPTNSPFCAKEGNIQRLNSKIRAFFFLVCCLAFGGMAFAQEQVTLTFTGANSLGDYVQLSSVEIRNLSRNWSETIVFPDSVYTLPVGTSVPQNPQEREMQVMPNPFDGHTRVNISSVETENVRMTLTDINGRQHAEYSGTLLSGDNYFEISLTMPQTYILTVRTVSGVRSLKMVNTGHGGVSRIEAAETSPRPVEVRLRNTSAHAFQPGDLMEFTGRASILGTPMTSVTVTQQQFHSEEILLVFNPASSAETVVTTDSIIFNGNDAFYAYGTVQSDIPVIACFMNAYYYYPNNDTANISTYGLLYNWRAAMGGANSSNSTPSGVQGICPEGWHLPSQNEFNTLIQQSGSSSFLGTILPGEYFAGSNGHLGFGTWAYFWTSTSTDNVYGDACGVSCNGSNLTLSPYEEQGRGFSVRCLRD